MAHEYDYIIAGGGCAGLSLAFHLLHSDLQHQRILVIDKSLKLQNDKTWCFWTSEHLPYAAAQNTSWREMRFSGKYGEMTQPISPLKYHCIQSLDFYQEIMGMIDESDCAERVLADVIDVIDESDGVSVITTKGTFTGKWLFNSIPERPVFEEYHIFLKQHFCGWMIETSEEAFDPNAIHLMDFQIKQDGEVRFIYILPYSKHKALVEFTVFSSDILAQEAYYKVLHDYLEEKLKLNDYWIDSEEFGVIPMTNYHFPKYPSEHIVNIGTAGGLTKPSTGYTFLNIQEDSRNIVKALMQTGRPQYKLKQKRRFKFYDTLLLHIIQNRAENIKNIFSCLFKRNDFRKILKFLDEKTTIWEDIWIISRLPWKPFLLACYEYYILKSWKKKNVQPQPVKEQQKVEYTV